MRDGRHERGPGGRGPRVELQGRRALQLSGGGPAGLFGGIDQATGRFALSPIACTIYVIILIILAWPVLFPLIRKLLPARAATAVESISAEPALQVAEHHHTATSDAGPPATGNREGRT